MGMQLNGGCFVDEAVCGGVSWRWCKCGPLRVSGQSGSVALMGCGDGVRMNVVVASECVLWQLDAFGMDVYVLDGCMDKLRWGDVNAGVTVDCG